MNSVTDSFRVAVNAGQNRLHELLKLTDNVLKLATLQTETDEFKNARFHFLEKTLIICVPVKHLADIEPLLALLEKTFGFDFDTTVDAPEYGWRQFESIAASWLRVDAELIADGSECRRVVVGYHDPLPIYKFECGEVQP